VPEGHLVGPGIVSGDEFAGKDGTTGGGTDGGCGDGIVKGGSGRCQGIQIGRSNKIGTVRTNEIRTQLVNKDQNDVSFLFHEIPS